MARRVFFSFHYQRDIWRVNQIRSIPNVTGCSAAGFQDASIWEDAKKKGDDAIKKLIRDGLKNTSVTVVCVGEKTAGRKYCQGRSKIRPPWRRKPRPLGSWVEWRNAAVRRGRQDAGVAAGWRACLLCSRRELSPFSSRMWTWWVSRSSSAPVSRSDPKISVHSLKGRFEVTSVDACS